MAVLKYRDPQKGFVTVPALMGPPGSSIYSITQTNDTNPSAKNTMTIKTTDGTEVFFDYYNGHGIKEVQQTVTSTESSGINKFRFVFSDSDNHYKDVQVMNGIGITQVQQTTTSTASGGNNVISVTLSDGTSSNFTVRNGVSGGIDEIRQGAPGFIEYTSPAGNSDAGAIKTVPVGAPSELDTSSTKVCVLGVAQDSSGTVDTSALKYNTNVYVNCATGVLMGAAWNDYAEYRETKQQVKAGRVVFENGDDTLSLAYDRMIPACAIVSDTFGFAIGETKKAKTPLAMAGRVLAYPNEDRNSYKPGDAVCSGPHGTVSKMSQEEKIAHPECIIGYVSCVPTYKIWGEKNIQVDNRIWIKVI